MAVATRESTFIGGAWVSGDGEEIEVRSPASGELLGAVRGSTPAQVDAAVRAAADAFPAWRRVSLLERVDLCRRAFTICMERAEDIAQTISREVGRRFDRWAFVHGNWALAASDPTICTVESELAIIMRHGGFGDFSFPAGRPHTFPSGNTNPVRKS